ncbi:uncharacterized protein METZ01_LOCUS356065, partial [marine metagenome]
SLMVKSPQLMDKKPKLDQEKWLVLKKPRRGQMETQTRYLGGAFRTHTQH